VLFVDSAEYSEHMLYNEVLVFAGKDVKTDRVFPIVWVDQASAFFSARREAFQYRFHQVPLRIDHHRSATRRSVLENELGEKSRLPGSGRTHQVRVMATVIDCDSHFSRGPSYR
jgi:hypothetical protein